MEEKLKETLSKERKHTYQMSFGAISIFTSLHIFTRFFTAQLPAPFPTLQTEAEHWYHYSDSLHLRFLSSQDSEHSS